MRLLYLTHRLPFAPNRGDRIRAYHTLKMLRGRADVDVISLVHDEEEAAHAGDLSFLVSSVRTARVNAWRGRRRAVPALIAGRPLTHAFLDSPELGRHIGDALAAHRPDVVLAYCSGMARLAITPPLDAYPFVLDMVDIDSAKWAALAAARPAFDPLRFVYYREARRLRQFERVATERAFATVVVNSREESLLAELTPAARIEIAGNGIDDDAFRRMGRATPDPVVVLCGVMNYEPNERAAIWLIEAVWPQVHVQRPDARLVIVGSAPTARLRDAASKHRSVRVTGTVDDVRPYLWQAAVSVAPMTVARGVQNKVLEAAAAGLPIVVTPQVMAGLPTEVTPACIEAAGAEDFGRAILRVLDLPAPARRELAGSADLGALSWAKRLEPLANLLEDAARSRPGSR